MYEERLVAFLDILGFSEAIKESAAQEAKLASIYSFLKRFSSKNYAKEAFSGFRNGNGESCSEADLTELKKHYNFAFTQFSDSFVISTKIEDKNASRLFPLLIAQFTNSALDLGFLIRGGVSIGKMVHEENGPVFGPAFVEAYLIESKLAVFGRTVISDEAFKFLNELGPYSAEFIDNGCDETKEITISSFINTLYKKNEEMRTHQIENAIKRITELEMKIPEPHRKYCLPKYHYTKSKLMNL